jgi:hypothetical protein
MVDIYAGADWYVTHPEPEKLWQDVRKSEIPRQA